jgi:hypothetical protein
MKQVTAFTLALALCSAALLHADATIRYKTDVKAMPALQPLIENMMKTQGTGSEVSVRMKGSKAYTSSRNFVQIFDFDKQEVTVIDQGRKTYAVLPVSKLAETLAAAVPHPPTTQNPSVQQIMSSVTSKVDSKMTGQTALIQGVQAEEREVTVTLEMPIPNSTQPAPTMKIVMHVWNAKASEAINVPVIRELTAYNAWQRYVLSPTAMLEKMTGQMPGAANVLNPMIDEMTKNPTVILRMDMAIYTPLAAMIAKKMPQAGSAQPIDPDAPFLDFTQDVAELSNAPVDAALFEVPKDYTVVPAASLFAALTQPPVTPQPAAASVK